MDKEQFGNLITVLRKQQGLSQKEFARRLAVSPSAVSKWEHGNNLPDVVMLNEIATILDVTCDELMNPKGTLGHLNELGSLTKKQTFGEKYTENDKKAVLADGEAEKKPCVRKKTWQKIVLILIIAFLLVIGACIGLHTYNYPQNGAESGIHPVSSRYRQDDNYGKMFEISCVIREDIDETELKMYVSNLGKIYIRGKTVDADAKGFHIFFYGNDSDALEWSAADYEYVSFFQ